MNKLYYTITVTLFLNVVTIYLEATSFVTKIATVGRTMTCKERISLFVIIRSYLLLSNKTSFILVTKMVTILQKKKKKQSLISPLPFINNVLSVKTQKLGVGHHFKGNLSKAKYWGRMPKMFSFQLPIVEKLPTTPAVDNRRSRKKGTIFVEERRDYHE